MFSKILVEQIRFHVYNLLIDTKQHNQGWGCFNDTHKEYVDVEVAGQFADTECQTVVGVTACKPVK